MGTEGAREGNRCSWEISLRLLKRNKRQPSLDVGVAAKSSQGRRLMWVEDTLIHEAEKLNRVRQTCRELEAINSCRR